MAEEVLCKINEVGEKLAAALQDVIAKFDLDAMQSAMAVGETFAWVHIMAFMPRGKEGVLAQMDRSAEAARAWADSEYDGFRQRLETIALLNAGESGGRLQ